MALIKLDFNSVILKTDVNINVIIPTDRKKFDEQSLEMSLEKIYEKEEMRVLYFLHGAHGSGSKVIRFSNIERYAEENRVIVILIDAQNSFYKDMYKGEKYETYLTKEVPTVLKKCLNINLEKENTYIAGLSMGGYGAARTYLKHPELFNGFASLSGVLGMMEADEHMIKAFSLDLAFEDINNVKGTDDDIHKLLKDAVANNANIRIYQACGKEDFVYNQNQEFKKLCEDLKIKEYTYSEEEGYGHEWRYWDKQINFIISVLGGPVRS